MGDHIPSFYVNALLALCDGESTGHWGFPSQRPVTRSFAIFFEYAPEETVGQTIETPVIWYAMALTVTSL